MGRDVRAFSKCHLVVDQGVVAHTVLANDVSKGLETNIYIKPYPITAETAGSGTEPTLTYLAPSFQARFTKATSAVQIYLLLPPFRILCQSDILLGRLVPASHGLLACARVGSYVSHSLFPRPCTKASTLPGRTILVLVRC